MYNKNDNKFTGGRTCLMSVLATINGRGKLHLRR